LASSNTILDLFRPAVGWNEKDAFEEHSKENAESSQKKKLTDDWDTAQQICVELAHTHWYTPHTCNQS
jgi:hypothetical protein